ncbi:MAG TPA: hypothetical protein PLW68_11755 [Casimicrobiaceae bacterium]|nr:hypothetical protein [Casimicrobiaceae bacterium]
MLTGFFGDAFRLADCPAFLPAGFAAFRDAGFAGRLEAAAAFLEDLPAGLAARGFDLGFTFDLPGDLRAGFAGFLAMVILDGNAIGGAQTAFRAPGGLLLPLLP